MNKRTSMRTKSTNNTLLFLVILLCLVVAGLGFHTYNFQNEVQQREAQLVNDKERVTAQLDEELSKYSSLLKERDALKGALKQAQSRLLQLKETLQDDDLSRSKMQQFQMEIQRLRREREFFITANDSLQLETKRLAALQQETQKALDLATKSQDSIQKSNRDLAERLTQGARLTVSNLAARGVIQRNSGKFFMTSRASRVEMMQVCFTVNDNQLAEAENKSFYVQVVNSQGRMIGVERNEKFEDGSVVRYNTKTTIAFNKTAYTICELVLPVQQMEGGDYTINVYHEGSMLLSTILSLK
ncbi:hypothetical protein [Dokdonia sp. R86516]|uniref:hypothetical protein n=1 Tax=Dokdonia sp. R86516 TaxID=3093856 RepID=UPI0037CB4B44